VKRNFRTEGIVLKNNRFGEIHKGVVFLSPEHGIMDAVATAPTPPREAQEHLEPALIGNDLPLPRPGEGFVKIMDFDAGNSSKASGAACEILRCLPVGGNRDQDLRRRRGGGILPSSFGLRFLDSCPEGASPGS
jgi:hypothetical protein